MSRPRLDMRILCADLLAELERLARAGAVCPDTNDLAAAIGCDAAKLKQVLRSLKANGDVVVEMSHDGRGPVRVVRLPRLGLITADPTRSGRLARPAGDAPGRPA